MVDIVTRSLGVDEKIVAHLSVWMVTGLAGVILYAIKRTRYCQVVD